MSIPKLDNVCFGPLSKTLVLTESTHGKCVPFVPPVDPIDAGPPMERDQSTVLYKMDPVPVPQAEGSPTKVMYFIVPCIPSAEYRLPSEEEQKSVDPSKLPFNGKVYEKVPLKGALKESMTCVASGRRSALVYQEDSGKWYRLKGCGDVDLGFHDIDANEGYGPKAKELINKVKHAHKDDQPDHARVVTVRGSSWQHTTLRELHMNYLVCELLGKAWIAEGPGNRKHPFQPAMVSRCMWSYTGFTNLMAKGVGSLASAEEAAKRADPQLSTMQCDILRPVCGVFEAYGERRLESHLLRGFERLFKHFRHQVKPHIPEIIKRFPESRMEGETTVSEGWMQFLFQTSLLALEDDGTTKEVLSQSFLDAATVIHELEAKLEASGKLPVPAEHPESPVSAHTVLEDLTNKVGGEAHLLSGIFALAIQVGYEAGFAVRTMQKNGVSWGTYDDALGTHCNAHPNNLVVLRSYLEKPLEADDDKSFIQLTAPLDFDMAYRTKDSFTPQDQLKEYFHLERNSMAMCLGRSAMNSGAEDMEDFEECPELVPLVAALRDCTCFGFVHGLQALQPPPHASTQTFAALRSIVVAALKLSEDVIA